MLKEFLFYLLIILMGTTAVTASNEEYIVFKDVNVIPMNKEIILKEQVVVIKGEKITSLGDEEKIPDDAKIVDGRGMYMMPGLFDMHVHIGATHELKLYLANGITTLRNMWGTPSHLEIIKYIEKGDLPGLRIYTTGPIANAIPVPQWPEETYILRTAEDAIEHVEYCVRTGYDYIKIYDHLSREVFYAIIEAAEEYHIPVVGHVPTAVGIKDAILAGQSSIEHLTGYANIYFANSEGFHELIDLTVEMKVWNCPTLVVFLSLELDKDPVNLAGWEYVSQEQKKRWPRQQTSQQAGFLEFMKDMTLHLHEGGANLILGTDSNNPYIIPGFSIHQELELLVEAGLTPYEALRTGTYNSAKYLDMLEKLGTVEEGKIADLVLLRASPLEDISNTREIEGVMVGGKWYSRGTIDEMLENVKSSLE